MAKYLLHRGGFVLLKTSTPCAMPIFSKVTTNWRAGSKKFGRPVRREGQSLLCPYPYLSPGFQPGFNPGKPQNKRFALKGQEMRVPDEARTYCAKVRVRNSLDPASALLGRSIWRPLQGASLSMDDSQG